MIEGCKVFDQSIKGEKTTHGNVRKIATGQRNWLFACLSMLQRKLQDHCNRSKQATSTRC